MDVFSTPSYIFIYLYCKSLFRTNVVVLKIKIATFDRVMNDSTVGVTIVPHSSEFRVCSNVSAHKYMLPFVPVMVCDLTGMYVICKQSPCGRHS